MEVYNPSRLTALEVEQIRKLDPIHNLAGKKDFQQQARRRRLQSTPAGRAMSMYKYETYIMDW